MLAVILAGDDQDNFSMEGKAFVHIQGKSMLEYVKHAIENCSEIENVLVVDGKGSMIEHVVQGLKYAPDPTQHILFATCDIPFLTTEAVQDFLQQARAYHRMEADLYYPIVNKRDQERRFLGIRRTYVKLKEGTFTGGNLMLVRPSAIFPVLQRVERILELRKSPLALSAELGLRFIWGVLFSKLAGTLTIPKLEKRVEELFQIQACAVISTYPEIANDIDKSDDLLVANKILSG